MSKTEKIKNFITSYYAEFVQQLDPKDIINICSIQSHGLQQNSWINDTEAIASIEKAMKLVPGLPIEITVYRAGKMKIQDRPYLSATFSKSIAINRFSNTLGTNIHKIVLKKGSKIIPLCILNTDGLDPEDELIIAQSKLQYHLTHYNYVK